MNQADLRSISLRRYQAIFLMLVMLLLSSISCIAFQSLFPTEVRAPDEFPATDIVFRSEGYTIGFVNADGSDATYERLVVKDYGLASDWWRPVITGDNRTLIVKVVDSHYYISIPQALAIWSSGEFPILCQQWPPQQFPSLSPDQSHIFIRTEQGMALYDLTSCGIENAPPVMVYDNLFGVFSPDMQYIAYTDDPHADPNADRFIIVRTISTGEERRIGTGDYPAWSRDSQWLAYTGKDGIYVVDIVGDAEARRVIYYPNQFDEIDPTYSDGAYWQIPPEVSWSPDGQWLVYHRWLGTDYNTGIYPENNAIFKVNIETGLETKIIDGGMYPYWRWPAQP